MGSLDGRDFAGHRDAWIVRHGVQRGIEIISEASRHIPAELTDRHPTVPWREIRGIGNILRHTYFQVSDQLIWKIVQDDLPLLRDVIQIMKSSMSGQDD